MYGDYWKLDTLPFENNCDPQFFYRGPSHEAAVLKLQYVVEQAKGAAVLVGGHGLGKTYVTRVVESELPESCRPVIRLLFPKLNAAETLGLIARRLGVDGAACERAAGAADLIGRFEDRMQQLASEGAHPVLLIDDAHLMDTSDVLPALAMLLSASEVSGLGLSLILCGQPELLPQVQRVPALDQRVCVRTALQAFSPTETTAYIQHRLAICHLDQCMFDWDALQSLGKLSGGVPRRINQLCDLALLVGYADELSVLSRGEIEAAAEELAHVSID
ncbi:MAG: ExeA family protein [Planctomycetaceae bacterium]